MADPQEIQELLGKASAEEKTALVAAVNGYNQLLKRYNAGEGVSPRQLRDAKEFLDSQTSSLRTRYAAADDAASERFAHRKAAAEWLQANGYKVSRAKFYEDCKTGFPAVAKDGSLSRYQVLQYGTRINSGGPDAAAALEAMDAAEFVRRKAKADAEKAEMQVDAMRRALDAEWLPAADAWAELAGMVIALRDELRREFYAVQGELILLAGGDTRRQYETYEFCEGAITRAFNAIADRGYNVTLRRAIDGGKE